MNYSAMIPDMLTHNGTDLELLDYEQVVQVQRAPLSDFDKFLIQISFAAGYVYMLLAVVGIVLNAYVISRLAQLACHDYERFKSGCGLPLAAMSGSDLLSLLSINAMVVLNQFLPASVFTPAFGDIQCKVAMYLIHTMTGFSTWCWLFISALRYMAVYHPLWQISRTYIGPGSLLTLLAIMLTINGWLPMVVTSDQGVCGEQSLSDLWGADWNRFLHGVELCWSYAVPAVLTLILDIRVLLTRPPSFARMAILREHICKKQKRSLTRKISGSIKSSPLSGLLCLFGKKKSESPRDYIRSMSSLQTDRPESAMDRTFSARYNDVSPCERLTCPENGTTLAREDHLSYKTSHTPRSNRRGRKAVRRWLAITTIHLLLNAPDNVLRSMTLLGLSGNDEYNATRHIVDLVARLLYFTQFCFNAAYLSTIVYRRTLRPKRRNTPQKSIMSYQILDTTRPPTRMEYRSEYESGGNAQLVRRYSDGPRLSDLEEAQRKKSSLRVAPLNSVPLSSFNSRDTLRSDAIDYGACSPYSPTPSMSPTTECPLVMQEDEY